MSAALALMIASGVMLVAFVVVTLHRARLLRPR
jgi:hypothetical protein